MAAKKKATVSVFERSLIETAGVRGQIAADGLPLFDHLVVMAKHSHKVGYAARAGRELRMARQLVRKFAKP
jgi:hypothetical protein